MSIPLPRPPGISCPRCGYSFAGLETTTRADGAVSVRCPECGRVDAWWPRRETSIRLPGGAEVQMTSEELEAYVNSQLAPAEAHTAFNRARAAIDAKHDRLAAARRLPQYPPPRRKGPLERLLGFLRFGRGRVPHASHFGDREIVELETSRLSYTLEDLPDLPNMGIPPAMLELDPKGTTAHELGIMPSKKPPAPSMPSRTLADSIMEQLEEHIAENDDPGDHD
jgi:hypothetical protein